MVTVSSTALLFLLLLLPPLAHAATYTATPSTFGAMLSRLGPGDTLELQSGTYPPLSYHRYRFPSGTSWANAPRIVAARGAQVRTPRIQLQDVGFLHFSGINVMCSGGSREGVYLGEGTHHIRVQQAEVTGCGAQGILVPRDSGGHHQFLHLNIHHNGTRSHFDHGVYLSAANNTLAHSYIHHNAGYGVHVFASGVRSANNNLIQGNRIEHNGQRGSTTYGLLLQDGNGNAAVNNTVRNNGTGDIRVGDRTSGTVLRGNQTGSPDVRQGPTSGTGGPSGGEGPPPEPPPFVLPPVPQPPPPPAMPRPTQALVLPPRPT